MAFTPRLVLVTVPSLEQARGLAGLILKKRLAVCVNLVPGLESHYWWKGRIETGTEILLLIKSSAEQFEALRELVVLHHAYECPEVLAIDPAEIAPLYREWWEQGLSGESGGATSLEPG